MPDLPETTDIVRYVDLSRRATRVYRDLVRDSYAELGKGEVTVTNILTRLLRLSQLTGGLSGMMTAAPRRESVPLNRRPWRILSRMFSGRQKLVIIARFIPEIRAICRLLQKKDIKYSLVSKALNREEQVVAFQNDPEVQVFVGQIATAGLGITLTAASTMVFYSLDYSMSNFEQAKAGSIAPDSAKTAPTFI